MTKDDETRDYLTPSGWHDDASRDAGHDEMQAALFRYFRDAPPDTLYEEYVGRELVRVRKIGHWVEFPLVARGHIIGFVDVAVKYETVVDLDPGHGLARQPQWLYQFYELKPKIGSVGGVIRQCEAIKRQAIRAGFEHFRVVACVYEDDPKCALVRELTDLSLEVWPWPRRGRLKPGITP